MSVYGDILTQSTAVITALQLTYTPDGSSDPVAATVTIRKLPRALTGMGDTLPLIIVCPHDRPEKIEPASMEAESGVFVWYLVEYVVIAPGNMDMVSNLMAYLDWREKIRRAFQDPVPIDVDEVIDTEILPEAPLDREKAKVQYDYSALAVRYRCLEPRNNAVAAQIAAAASLPA